MRLLCLLPWLFLAGPALAQTCPPFGWHSFTNPGPQDYEIREVIPKADGTEILGITFAELSGTYAKVYIFAQMRDGCMLKAVSLGSYAYLAGLGDGSESRPFHLDLYEPEMHSTLGFYDRKLSYEEVRERALETLK